jgi:uncharacterized OsmC-like protein
MQPDTIKKTVQLWTAEPDKAKGAPAVVARTEGATAVVEVGSFKFSTDLPPPLGGTNAHPSPTAYLLGALAGCAAVFIRDTLAPQADIPVESVEAKVSCTADNRGLLGIGGAPPDLGNLRIEVTIVSPAGPEAVNRLAALWRERCPVYLALTKANSVATEFRAG